MKLFKNLFYLIFLFFFIQKVNTETLEKPMEQRNAEAKTYLEQLPNKDVCAKIEAISASAVKDPEFLTTLINTIDIGELLIVAGGAGLATVGIATWINEKKTIAKISKKQLSNLKINKPIFKEIHEVIKPFFSVTKDYSVENIEEITKSSTFKNTIKKYAITYVNNKTDVLGSNLKNTIKEILYDLIETKSYTFTSSSPKETKFKSSKITAALLRDIRRNILLDSRLLEELQNIVYLKYISINNAKSLTFLEKRFKKRINKSVKKHLLTFLKKNSSTILKCAGSLFSFTIGLAIEGSFELSETAHATTFAESLINEPIKIFVSQRNGVHNEQNYYQAVCRTARENIEVAIVIHALYDVFEEDTSRHGYFPDNNGNCEYYEPEEWEF